ncbi:bacteriohemerythrin [Magnetospirillum sp. SS-4]|uniref:bacteriohemerythrin n=1 Tax=Magnetospirillum sp. SS-4 TaxID=2681465 RepID=UPI0013823446|nr:bacteriohemerythrin [Magnetospirillum sp. SS-4]CAA7615593.1 Hemerythrin-like protein [Magnetospirillum sp. SS-4]
MATWHQAMKVGIEVVDEDHRQLFALIQEFNAAADSHGGEVDRPKMTDVLARLQSYVTEHFEREETAQLEAGYDGYEENKRQHDELTHTLAVFTEKFHSGGPGEIKADTAKLRTFLGVWLSQHILKTDVKMRGRILPWAG